MRGTMQSVKHPATPSDRRETSTNDHRFSKEWFSQLCNCCAVDDAVFALISGGLYALKTETIFYFASK